MKPIRELPGMHVTVDEVVYKPDAPAPPERPYCFVYSITIHNRSSSTVTIKGRKWVVKNTRGETVVVEGDGVVGQCPTLAPGESFSYNSFHLLDTPAAKAEGSYVGQDEHGEPVLVRIPTFTMEARQAWS